MKPVEQYYIEKDIEADDEESIIKDDDLSIDNSNDIVPKTSDKTDKSLKDELKSDISKNIVKTLTGQRLNFDRIKRDENLLKKNILKVIFINSNRRVNNKFLKKD